MSTVASAYILRKEFLPEVKTILMRKNDTDLWSALKAYEIDLGWRYSGFVLAIAIVFVGEKGIKLPCPSSLDLFNAAQEKELGIVTYGNQGDYQETATRLAAMRADDSELARVFAELSGGVWEDAPAALRAGFQFFQKAISALRSESDLLIVSIR